MSTTRPRCQQQHWDRFDADVDLPVIPYDDEAEAIRLANATWSGLCSSVWSGDAEHVMAVPSGPSAH